MPASEQEITDRIFSAVMEQRLPPGTKLSENILCEAFRASRARIRRALLILAERGVVELRSNRGAFVANPSADNARHVFAARRAIEPAIVREAVQHITDEQLSRLGDHIEGEAVAQATARHREAIRQSGAFHVRLAEIGGNPVLARMLAELVARTSLIIGLFGASSTSCSEGDHRKLLEALSDRDADRAAELMVRHLDHIEKDLQLVDVRPARTDVRAVPASSLSSGRPGDAKKVAGLEARRAKTGRSPEARPGRRGRTPGLAAPQNSPSIVAPHRSMIA